MKILNELKMVYEIIGKLTVTIGILILIPIIWIIGFIFLDWISDQIDKLPDKLQAIIVFSIIGLMIIGLGVLIYNSL